MYKCVTKTADVREYISTASAVGLDIETSPLEQYRNEEKAALDAHKSQITGISFSKGEDSGIYVPLTHRIGNNIDNSTEFWEYLAEFLQNHTMPIIIHNAAFESAFFYARGIVVQEPLYDTIAASQLTLKSNTGYRTLADSGLKTLVPELLGVELPSFNDVTAGRHFDELDPNDSETIRYACADSDFALRLYHLFNGWFDKWLPKHRYIVEQIESPTAVYVGLMKYNGLLVDGELMTKKATECEGRLAKLRDEITFIIGDVPIGANCSTSAFKKYLYNDLKLPVLKTTAKYQEAADDETMILLAEWCEQNRKELVPLFKLIQEYRRVGKIYSTYVEGYRKHINSATGRIHSDLMPLATETGRFASRNPNLQNCFDDKTEILTKRGFILFRNLRSDDLVAEWENGEIYFVTPIEYISRPYKGRMVKLKNQHTDLCVTPDHRCLLQDRKNRKFYVVPAENYSKDAKQLHAAQYTFGSKSLTQAEIIILAATQADGSFRDGVIDFTFEKARKYMRLVNALRETDMKFSENVRKNGQVRIIVTKASSEWIYELLGERKVWGKWVLDYDRKTVKGLVEELYHWDGCFTRGNMYSSSIKENVDWMQILHALTGVRTHLREYDNGNPNAAINYQLDIVERDYSLTANIEKTEEMYDGMIYCVSVPSGYIMVRRGGQICITGNCPRAGADDIGVRNFFVAPEGMTLLSLDLSQIELRIGALYCRDEKMLETYRTGGDIHNSTADVVFGIKKHDKEERTIAKNVNFGTFYGLFPSGLQRTLKFKAGLEKSLVDCEQIISNLKAGYPGLTTWQKETIAKARVDRYSETWLGRRRYIPNIRSDDWGKRSFGERCALNTPIQGTAADCLKLSMGRIVAGLPKMPWLKPLLQIHDELVFELPTHKVQEAAEFIKSCMEAQPFDECDVPIIAEASVGDSFGRMEGYNVLHSDLS
jgi:DNA polymerase I-like protein with 3'-5' exonuclease and polymerase domains